ncbi:hypothetical protein PCANC_16896 [Puccinia coronata f. sp. avenae]|uniref:Uncharacterized protein n=1 Tax=Puccinia coronata f. sp. avenae TaxID=200324 RepID=A0A2N5SGD5_9BASI|nr:hypothetical protein PCANC_16896 [Puccinia coronata f. sp. avenae]
MARGGLFAGKEKNLNNPVIRKSEPASPRQVPPCHVYLAATLQNIPTLHLDTYQTPTTSPVDNILIKDKGALGYQHPSNIILILHQIRPAGPSVSTSTVGVNYPYPSTATKTISQY